MTTARDVVYGALRLLTVTASGESPTADEAADGLAALNQMISALELEQIYLGCPTLALNDAVPLPESHMLGLKSMLAVNLAPEYEKQPSPVVITNSNNFETMARAIYRTPETAQLEPELARMGR